MSPRIAELPSICFYDVDHLAAIPRVDLDRLLEGVSPTGIVRRCSSRTHSWARRQALGTVLARRRRSAGLDFCDVMEATGIDPRRLAMIESGADPGFDEAMGLIRLYGTTPAGILREAKAVVRGQLDMPAVISTVAGSRHGQPPGCDGSGA